MSSGAGSPDEAKAALQALLASSKSFGARAAASMASPSGGAEWESQDDREQESGSILRRKFRAEIDNAFRPSKAVARHAEVEGQVSRLLERVTAQGGPKAQASVPGPFLPPPRSGSSAGIAAATQTEPLLVAIDFGEEGEEEEDEEDEPPAGSPPPPRRPLVIEDEGISSISLREEVAKARRRLEQYDREVTKLTKQLKQCRRDVWERQRDQCATEARIAQLIADRLDELPPGAREEEQGLEKREKALAQELGEARARAARWSSVAKRQDNMLQQEREACKGGDAESVLAKHPAGEVFFHQGRDIDSDDGYNEGPRTQHVRRQSRDDEDFSSEDEVDPRGKPRGPPWRPIGIHASGPESAPDSDSSTPPSPSNDSSSMSLSTSGGVTGSHTTAGASSAAAPARRPRAASESSSEEEEAARNWRQQAVPPLPELAEQLVAHRRAEEAGRGRSMLRADEAEEVSSEEGIEEFEETSRSV